MSIELVWSRAAEACITNKIIENFLNCVLKCLPINTIFVARHKTIFLDELYLQSSAKNNSQEYKGLYVSVIVILTQWVFMIQNGTYDRTTLSLPPNVSESMKV